MIDPICIFHGKPASEHACLFCALCYEPLTEERCNRLPTGELEDVCVPCAKREARMAGTHDRR